MIFIDTGDFETIKKFHKFGIIHGVTTNPSILVKGGLKGGIPALKAHLIDVAKFIHPLPLSIEVLSNDLPQMIDQSIEFCGWADNIVTKIPIHGPEGELENLQAIHELETVHDVRVNVTAIMSAQQALLAAYAGGSYLSLFGGRVNNMGYSSNDEITKLRYLLDQESLKGQIIAASTREVLNVVEWISAGAHIVTVTPALLEGMIVHPYSKETVQMFLRDAASLSAIAAE